MEHTLPFVKGSFPPGPDPVARAFSAQYLYSIKKREPAPQNMNLILAALFFHYRQRVKPPANYRL
ncbi:MAG: hypothetical protein IPP31_06905 [Chitinophagaceae bacterium]|nr:hypothetical protein [Chitinophagaceae bacterium]